MADFDGWEKIDPSLGKGGQGVVYKARSRERVAQIEDAESRINKELRKLPGNNPLSIRDLAKFMAVAGGPDNIKDLGALKIFDIPADGSERAKELGRLDNEIVALRNISHPSVLKLLHSNIEKEFIVTEYHPLGTLDGHLKTFAGRALEALLAFRPLVEAVSLIHKRSAIHRDIKPKNIFIASDGHLVLGDFGIVLFKDAVSDRMTQTYDTQVGSRDWMAPWANTHRRLTFEEVNPTLDLYPLGKVLWCMVSGQPTLDLWYFNRCARGARPSNNIEDLFPGDPSMHVVNEILSKCVVEEEDNCIKSADELLHLVDQAVAFLRSPGLRPSGGVPWPCGVCGKGHYLPQGARILELPGYPQMHLDVFICDNTACSHVELFWNNPEPPKERPA
jgi:serine/threonine protein kinase